MKLNESVDSVARNHKNDAKSKDRKKWVNIFEEENTKELEKLLNLHDKALLNQLQKNLEQRNVEIETLKNTLKAQ